MILQTRYNYETTWRDTEQKDLLKIIEEEIGGADPQGTLTYIKEAVKKGRVISVGNCKFRERKEG